MKKVRITGIVRLANSVRQEVSGTISPERLTRLQRNVRGSLQNINRLLAEAGTSSDDLPAPSRKAYQFLSNIDFESIPVGESSCSHIRPPHSISFRGLRSYFDGILDRLARIDGQKQDQHIYDSICSTSENIEKRIQADDIRPEQLKPQSRDIRGWFAYFSQQQNFDAYIDAVRIANPLFHDAAGRTGKLPTHVHIHFRPMKGIYRLGGYRNLTLVQLPTPMICFEKETFQVLADLTVRTGRDKQQVMDATLKEPYQDILSDIDLLSGVTEHAAGVYHDLATSFDRVNATYFNGSIVRPRLTWSQTFTFRKFGHYDYMHDIVMVSISLDKKEVPEYVVDFIVYHELLHKKLGVKWSNGRKAAHNSEFLRKEQEFQQYNKAKAALKQLASSRK